MFRNGWKSATAAAALAIGAGWAMPAHATNGYFENGIDAEAKGEAGIGVSSSDGVMAAAYNPALGVKAGNSAGACLSFFMPHRDTTVTTAANPGFDLGTGTFDSGDNLFEVPCLGANFKIDDKSAVSLLLFAAGGMNTHYGSNPYNGYFGQSASTPMGVDLEQVFLQPSYARVVGYGITLGGGPVLAAQRFMAQGLQPFEGISSNPTHLTNNGYDYSYGGGFRIGAIWDPVPWLTAGVSYQSQMWMTNFEKYDGLFADGGSFDIPASVTEGITVRPIKTVGLSVEHQHIFYGDIASLNNGQNNSLPGGGGAALGMMTGSGFGWKDMDVYRVGAQWQATDKLALRTGYSHATDFTDGANLMFNIIAPATIKDHASIGASYDITPAWDVTLGYTHAFSDSFTANANPFDPAQTIKLRMDQDDVTVGFKYKW